MHAFVDPGTDLHVACNAKFNHADFLVLAMSFNLERWKGCSKMKL